MRKNNGRTGMVELTKSFDEVWKSLYGEGFELKTDSGTPFVARAKMARRRGFLSAEKVLVFLNTGHGKLKECSRCYSEDWGRYFNNLGGEGQRIGMYCKAVDGVSSFLKANNSKNVAHSHLL